MTQNNWTIKYLLQLLLSLVVVGLLAYGGYFLINELVSMLQKINAELATAIIAATTTIIVSVVSVLLAKNSESKRAAELEIRNRKIPVYEKFCDILFQLLKKDKQTSNPEKLNVMLMDLTKDMIIWGSDDVIKKWSEFRAGTSDETKILTLTENMLLSIRKDIGHKNKNINQFDLMTLFINDIDRFKKHG